jgi:hypothetical protein
LASGINGASQRVEGGIIHHIWWFTTLIRIITYIYIVVEIDYLC